MNVVAIAEQRTAEWLHDRHGVPSASKASSIITSKGEPSKSMAAYADLLAAEKFAGMSLDGGYTSAAMQRGINLEPAARAAYAFEHDADVVETGFVMHESGDFGASPDGLVGDDGLVEIKCCETKGHLDALMRWRKSGTPPTDYVMQVNFQMLATDRAWCDLYYWHPDLPAIAMRLERSAETDDALRAQIDACIARRDETLAALREISGQTTEKAA